MNSSSRDHEPDTSAALEYALRDELYEYMRDVEAGHFTALDNASRAARMISGMLKPGSYLDRILNRSSSAEQVPSGGSRDDLHNNTEQTP